jgi:hypothetical protein
LYILRTGSRHGEGDHLRSWLQRRASVLGISLEYESSSLSISCLRANHWAHFHAQEGVPVVCSYRALQWTCGESRHFALSQIHALAPKAVICSEDELDMRSSALAERFENAWSHVASVLSLLESSEPTPTIRQRIEIAVIRQRLMDLLATSERGRRQHPAPSHVWLRELRAIGGWCPLGWSEEHLHRRKNSEVEAVRASGSVSVNHRGRALLSVFAVRPRADRPTQVRS